MSFVVEAIAGAALSALFDVLFEKLKSLEIFNFATEAQVRRDIKKWEETLSKLQIVLEDAEEKQITDRLVKSWLLELKHLAYDVEDILDEFSTECLLRKLKGEHQAAASSSRTRRFIPACGCFTGSTPWGFSFDREDMMSKIRGINNRFEDILKDKEKLTLVESRTSPKTSERHPTTCLPDEPTVYGRDGDKAKILELLRCESGDAKIGVISIFGMGGVGKTTLAKLVYNDNSVDCDFQVKAWVCVSDAFDVMRVTKAILESITGKSSDLKELNAVQLELKKCLAGKKFLLVLDDVWTEKYEDWDVLRPPFMDGAVGSKIIVTTRSAVVAGVMRTFANYDLKLISNEDCWSLFAIYAFENRSIDAHPELETIGRKLVNERCGGLPLAAKALGSLLRFKQRPDQWNEILNNKLWTALDGSRNISPVLYLSYYYLPSHLKRCFAYCAVLPKDYEFKQEEIILLWMAEGLIPHNEKREMEDLGNDYFDDLISRSIFQASNTDKSRFIMHDLVNDLAQEVAGDVCFRLENKVDVGEALKLERVRYSSYIQSNFECAKRFAPFRNMKCLRTFLPLSSEGNGTSYIASCVPYELVQNLKFVRVLSLRDYAIEELPDSIGGLKHLRYLDLSYTDIEVLPESTTLLCNLQTLILKRCRYLRKLPARMDNLTHLRHLNMEGVRLVEGIPLDIKQLSGLRSLPEVTIGKESFPIANLMNLKSLRGRLSITNLDKVVDDSDASKARMIDKEGIHVLNLTWGNTEVDEVQYGVLDALQPHENLNQLVIIGYAGADFPPWMANSMHSNIMHLRLEGCKKCVSLPQLGMLRNLKELFIKEMSSLQKVDQDFYGNNCPNPFPCLEVLWFEEMHHWEEWIVCAFEFRALRELCIRGCGKLVGGLPIHLPSLEKLVISGSENLVASLPILPKLSVLEIYTCKVAIFSCKDDFGSLTFLGLANISSITNPVDGFLHRLKKFKKLLVSDSLTEAFYSGSNLECIFGSCPQLMSIVIDEDKEQLQLELVESELESLTLEGCRMLEKLPAWIVKLMLLKKLTIRFWPNLVTIPQGTMYQSRCFEKLTITGCHSLISLGRRQLPPTLKKLSINVCRNLKSLLGEEDEGETYSPSSTNLQVLKIYDCKSLASISCGSELLATLKRLVILDCSNLTCVLPRGILPSRLQSLEIRNCKEVESIAERFDHNTSLESLTISGCLSLKSLPEGFHNLLNLRHVKLEFCPCIVSFPKGGLPITCLTKLSIYSLKKLEALPDNIHRLSSLQEVSIESCESLVSFPNQGLPSSLTLLYLRYLEKLAALPDNMHRLSFLESLVIYDCPSLVSFPSECLPSNLTSLQIRNLQAINQLFELGLDRLNSLRELDIEGRWSEMKSFPSDETGMMLPPSLISLSIIGFPNLECLSTRGFRELTSLEYLRISDCPKLASLPKNGLPDSLLKLNVSGCPILEQRYKEGEGPEWSKILNIPYVFIEDSKWYE